VNPKHRVVVIDERAVNVFTDGSSYSGPRRGGIGYRIVTVDEDGHEVVHDCPQQGFRSGTNQEMELMACIAALRDLGGRHPTVDVRGFSRVVLHTDSTYVADNYTSARFTWPTTGWMTRDGNPVVNAQLWKDLVSAVKKVGSRVDIQWGKGHSSVNPHNKAVDKLAKASAKGVLQEPIAISRVRRKQSPQSTEPGSIVPEGQKTTIRIITDRWLKTQRLYVYKIEVVSPRSPFYQKVDNFFSEIMLDAGHTYVVEFNDDVKRPRIIKNCGEVTARTSATDVEHDVSDRTES
jgi:ribonuclease HI